MTRQLRGKRSRASWDARLAAVSALRQSRRSEKFYFLTNRKNIWKILKVGARNRFVT
jgi:hypothetical protein